MGSTFTLGTLGFDPISPGLDTIHNTPGDANIYKFNTTRTENLNLLVKNISQADSLKIELFEDKDGNGAINTGDALVQQTNCGTTSDKNPTNDGTINRRDLAAGNYLVRVTSNNHNGDATYSLAAAVGLNSVDNRLLARNNEMGNLTSDRNFTGSVNNFNMNNFYHFNLQAGKEVKISMTMDGGDADMRVFKDNNNNQLVDLSGTELSSSPASQNKGDTPELITLNTPGDYYLEVKQFTPGAFITTHVNFDVV